MKRITGIALLICLNAFALTAQDLGGFWKGTFSMQGCFLENNIELQLTMNGETATGDSYHYQDIDNYVKKKITARYDASQKKLLVQEGLVTTYHIPHRCMICIKEFDLSYSRVGNLEILKGLWSGNVLNTNLPCGGDSIILTRIKESAFKEVPEIKVDTGSIRLDFYDDAIVDGDSISVMVDNVAVLSHQRLTEKPLTVFVTVDLLHPFHEVEMIAENLGSIPPNTAMLIITAGDNRYHLSLSSTTTKSAKVRFVYEAKEAINPVQPKLSMR